MWWPGDPPFSDPVFQQLVDLGDRLVINASDFTDLAGGLKRLAAIRRRLGVGDIAWERLAPWHELTAQFFDAPRFRRFLPNLSRLDQVRGTRCVGFSAGRRITVAGRRRTALCGLDRHSPRVAARRVAGATGRRWIRLSLEGRYEMVDLAIEQVPTAAVPPGELLSVRLGRTARRALPSSSWTGPPPRRPW